MQNHCTSLFPPAVYGSTYFPTSLSIMDIIIFNLLSEWQANHDLSFVLLCRFFLLFVKVTVYLLVCKHPYFHGKDEIWVSLNGMVEVCVGNFRGCFPWGHLGKWFWMGGDFPPRGHLAVSGDIFGSYSWGAGSSWPRSQGCCWTSYNVQDSACDKDLSRPNISNAKVENPDLGAGCSNSIGEGGLH